MRRAILLSAAAAALAASAVPASAQQPPTLVPGQLTVALSLPFPGLQAGAVRPDGSVSYARGLEIDMVRDIATRLGITDVRFVNEPFFSRLLTAGPKTWDMAVAGVTITADRRERVGFSRAYLDADQAVLVRRNLASTPTTIDALKALQLCTERNSTGYRLIRTVIRPAKAPKQAGNAQRLLGLLQSGTCDAAVYDSPVLGAEVASAPDRYGPIVGRLVTGEKYGIVFPKASSALRGRVDGVVKQLVADGTIRRLSTRWISTDVRRLPVIPTP